MPPGNHEKPGFWIYPFTHIGQGSIPRSPAASGNRRKFSSSNLCEEPFETVEDQIESEVEVREAVMATYDDFLREPVEARVRRRI